MADLEGQFQQAAKDVANLLKRPGDDELLNIYGLYKQATVGDNTQAKPSMFQLKENAKHDAWLKRKGLSKDEAKQEYINLTKALIEKYGLK